jgi:hypothetical protein
MSKILKILVATCPTEPVQARLAVIQFQTKPLDIL